MRPVVALLLALAAMGASTAERQSQPATGSYDPLRGPTAVNEASRPAPLATIENKDVKRTRSYAMQPPTIPHAIDNYQIDRFANRCLMCHSRSRAGDAQATPIGITHYLDRDLNFLADVAPHRYFCDTCHVVQMDTRPEVAVPNTFQDAESLARRSQAASRAAAKKK